MLVDEVTRQVTSAAIAYEDAGEHAVKGKREPLRCGGRCGSWRASAALTASRAWRRRSSAVTAICGWSRSCSTERVERRAARLVAISGEAGVGKSRLRREFSNYIDGLADTVLWHSGRCLSYGEGVAYWALAEMVRQRLGIPEDAAARGRQRRSSPPAWSGGCPIRPIANFSRRGWGRCWGWRSRAWIGRSCSRDGGCSLSAWRRMSRWSLVFEDMQWADQGLFEFIEQLLDWSAT